MIAQFYRKVNNLLVFLFKLHMEIGAVCLKNTVSGHAPEKRKHFLQENSNFCRKRIFLGKELFPGKNFPDAFSCGRKRGIIY